MNKPPSILENLYPEALIFSFLFIVLSLSLILLTQLSFSNRNTPPPSQIQVLGAANQIQEEKEFFLNVVTKNPTYLPGWVRLYEINKQLGLTREAKNAYQKALQLDPNQNF